MQQRTYVTYKGIECLNSCLYNYIYAKGFEICHGDIFFLGQGLDITYTGYLEDRMIYSRQYESNYMYLKKFLPCYEYGNIVNESENDNNIDNLRKFLVSAVYDSKDIIIQVSAAKLPYNKVYPHNDTISHFINILDYDDADKKFCISDGCPPIMTNEVYKDWIDEKEVINNWESMGGRYVILSFDNNRMGNVQSKSEEEFHKQLRAYIKGRNGLIKKRYKGYRSIITLLNDMIPLFENNVPDIKQIIMNVYRQLKINGFLQAKEFILDKAENLWKKEDVCEEYAHIIEEWNKETLLLIKAGIRADLKEFRYVIRNMEKITEKELIVLNKMIGRL